MANATVERGVVFPDNAVAVSNLEPMRHRRLAPRGDIQRWKQTLDRLGLAAAAPDPTADGSCKYAAGR